MREFLLLTLAALAAGAPLLAQDEAPPPPKGWVQIAFLPPPMDGTLSLGIYGKGGKLVRTLKKEVMPDNKEFVVGLNGLITQWDGKDDAGKPAGPGTYAVRGFCVGFVEISGEAFHCNDWINSDDSPHLAEITALSPLASERVCVTGKLADGTATMLMCGLDGQAQPMKGEAADEQATLAGKVKRLSELTKGKVEPREGSLVMVGKDGATLPELHRVLDLSPGKGGSLWVIDRDEKRVEVQQYSKEGEFLRRLSVTPGDPVPAQIAASDSSDLIFLLERAEGVQRVRALALETLKSPLPADVAEPGAGAPKSSTWRIAFSKTIRRCDDFAQAADHVGRPVRPKPESKIAVKLLANPLFQNSAATVEVMVGSEATGSFLQSADGLPLRRLTDTPGLKWAVLVKETKGYALLQSDGAVVEEYRLGKLTNMMAFDAGEYELK